MKTMKELLDYEATYDYTYAIRNAIQRTALYFTYRQQITEFLTLHPEANLTIDSDQIWLSNATRESLRDFLLTFGGKWTKEVEEYYPDKMRYFREEEHPFPSYEGNKVALSVRQVPPPPTCKIIEEEVEVPAHKELRRRIQCTDNGDVTAETTPVANENL